MVVLQSGHWEFSSCVQQDEENSGAFLSIQGAHDTARARRITLHSTAMTTLTHSLRYTHHGSHDALLIQSVSTRESHWPCHDLGVGGQWASASHNSYNSPLKLPAPVRKQPYAHKHVSACVHTHVHTPESHAHTYTPAPEPPPTTSSEFKGTSTTFKAWVQCQERNR